MHARLGHVTKDAHYLAEMIRAGWIDTIHAYGDFDKGGFTRPMAEAVLAEFKKQALNIAIFSNHGSDQNLQNLGHQGLESYQKGDVPSNAAYHLDITQKLGVKFVWVDTALTPSPIAVDPIYRKVIARDGSTFFVFNRYRGLAGKPAPNAGSLAEQMTVADIDKIIATESTCVYYQHFGVREKNLDGSFSANSAPYFSIDALNVLSHLAAKQKSGECLVAGVGRLLSYMHMRSRVGVRRHDDDLILFSDDGTMALSELMGVTVHIPHGQVVQRLLFASGDLAPVDLEFEREQSSNQAIDVIFLRWIPLVGCV
jgi:hypothetical protein